MMNVKTHEILNKILKAFVVASVVILLIFVGYIGVILFAFGAFDSDYSVSELKESFIENKSEIYDLKNYFESILPDGKSVEIEFEDDSTVGRFSIYDATNEDSNRAGFLEWDLEIDTKRMDSIIKPLGWTKETLEVLKAKLDKANCIGITSGEPIKINFKRSGMGMYSFNVFTNPVPDSLKKQYNNNCDHILVNSKLALEYGGGAVGGQCFYNFE